MRRIAIPAMFLVAAPILAPAPARGDVVTLIATADARINRAFPSSKYGASAGLRVRLDPAGEYRSLLRFEVVGLGGAPSSARVRLFVTDASPDGGSAYVTSGAWTESLVTWSNAPQPQGLALDSAGSVAAGAWAEIDVTGADGVYNFVVVSQNPNSAFFSSREELKRPELVVDATPAEPDTTPPSVPQNLTAAAVSATEVDLAWGASTDDRGVVGYAIFRDGVEVAQVPSTVLVYADRGLSPQRTYRYEVEAFDGSGNRSGLSDRAYATTGLLPPAGAAADVVAAGDIACDPASSSFNGGAGTSSSCKQGATSDLILSLAPDAVLTLGDNQYEDGALTKYNQSYHPSWGRVKAITYPSAGNHEYRTAGAAGYFDYFGAAAGDRAKGYYSFDIGAWHLIALNSNCSKVGGCGAGSPQEQWLRADLAAHPAQCTLAYWHHPRFSSESNATSSVGAFWSALYAFDADLVLNGHSHIYERFAPISPTGGGGRCARDPRDHRRDRWQEPQEPRHDPPLERGSEHGGLRRALADAPRRLLRLDLPARAGEDFHRLRHDDVPLTRRLPRLHPFHRLHNHARDSLVPHVLLFLIKRLVLHLDLIPPHGQLVSLVREDPIKGWYAEDPIEP